MDKIDINWKEKRKEFWKNKRKLRFVIERSLNWNDLDENS